MTSEKKEIKADPEVVEVPEAAEEAAKPKKNKDGLVPGQPVDFATIIKAERARAKKKG